MDKELETWKEKIPSHWEVKRLGEVTEKMSNGSSLRQYDENVGYPISRIETIWNQKIDINRVKYIKEIDSDIVEKYRLKLNDILFSHINSDIHLGKTAIYKGFPKILIHGINLLLIRANENVDPNYLNFFFVFTRSNGKFISIAQKSVNQSSINQSKLKNLPIPLPPLAVQQTIVAKIEELFSELEKGKEQLETALAQLKVYRQSLLQAAFENNDYPILNLLDVTTKIQIGPFGTQLHKEDYVENGVPLINPMHIQNGKIIANNSYSISEEKKLSLPNYILKEGDVILGRRGEMGRCGLVTKNEEGWFCGTGSLYIRPKELELYSKYLYYYLSSQTVKKYLELNAGGTTMANLNLKIVNELPLRVPKIDIQLKIVNELESKLTVCDKIEETIKQSLAKAEVLRQSILKQAFEGKLVRG